MNNGYITDISVLPYIRPQQIGFEVKGLLVNTPVKAFFDGKDVSEYITTPNTVELTNVTSTNGKGFQEDDVVGYYTGGKFYPTGRVLGVYTYPGTSNTRLYIAADQTASTYSTNGTIQNAQYNTTGAYSSTNGLLTGISDVEMPGSVTIWQKYCNAGARERFSVNLFGCNGFGLVGFLSSTLMYLFMCPKKETPEGVSLNPTLRWLFNYIKFAIRKPR